jgi:hypothetical protein
MSQPETLTILQRQYGAFTKRGAPTSLETHNVLSCTVFAGIEHTSGVGFLCHFDTPCSTKSLNEIVALLSSKIPAGTRFDTHIVNGSWFPFWPFSAYTRRRLLSGIRSNSDLFNAPKIHGFIGPLGRATVALGTEDRCIRRISYFWRVPEPQYPYRLSVFSSRMHLAELSA